MSTVRKIKLKCSDGVIFEVDEYVGLQSNTIKRLIEDHCDDNGVPLEISVPKVTSEILSKVIEYCEKHALNSNANPADRASSFKDIKNWDAEFLKVDQTTLFGLILAANFLNIRSLLELTCGAVANMIKGKTPEQIIQFFNMPRD